MKVLNYKEKLLHHYFKMMVIQNIQIYTYLDIIQQFILKRMFQIHFLYLHLMNVKIKILVMNLIFMIIFVFFIK